jgi:nitrogen PTS system EIIA component
MISDTILKAESVICNASARSKKHSLEIVSELLANASPGMPHDEIFAKLVERERLGSTGLGQGVAFPHCRFAGIEEVHAALVKLAEPVDFESPDDEPVDLIFAVMVPEQITDSHRDEIAKISETLKDERVQAQLRGAATERELHEAFLSAQRKEHVGDGTRSVSRGT